MVNLLRDIVAFLRAVLRYWVVLMGGLIMTVITLIERERGSGISPKIYWPIILGFVTIAVFLAWRTERQRWERLGTTRLSVGPKAIVGTYEGRTDVQGKALAAVYVGKWLELRGSLGNVTVYNTLGVRIAIVTFEGFRSPNVFFKFRRSWVYRLSMLRAGDRITILGQVEKVERSYVWLHNCELVDVCAVESKKEEANHATSSQNVGSIPNSKTD